ncbi:hypothetical protein LWP59_25325 [Amycolatopsis acidiphila]|uniref:MFS transporter n=1 Tax=Amycolatopsis acidiphila TaxID=715473 RepID=A0A558AL99_9PSEU|nr:hypothetical protein [Amycolatopsis acidiphila]TVT25034.1 hypothetical protein FNH06_04230 [Amycolatopsis acidiphila]UIJ57458.1 hypothetical protein LWP59_25325 [Amycolatopsis acidiphila]GHG84114.1 hypothetical protein GCM10017788_55720 [Amycolatopsis acidiphila]
MYETGVRIGTALGTAIASALFFGTLAGTHGDCHAAVAVGLISPAVLVGLAFLIGLTDVIRPVHATATSREVGEVEIAG